MKNKISKVGVKFSETEYEKIKKIFEFGGIKKENWEITLLLTPQQKRIIDEYLAIIPDMAIFSVLCSKVWLSMYNEVWADGCEFSKPELSKTWKWKYLLEFRERK